MMHEIKFRAWVEKDSRIHAVRLIDFLPTGTPMAMRVCDPYQIDDDGNVDFDFSEYREGFILEQYTGLKDKNGKEIYEGDIVKTASHWSEHEKLIQAVECDCVYWEPFNDSDWGWLPERSEVIGNIHENPELL